MERVIQGLPVVTGPQWAGVEYFCTTRAGGVGVAPHDTFNLGRRAEDNPDTVTENRRRLRAALPAEPLWLRQVHGADVVDADDPATPQEPAADASVTARPGRVLAVMVADCLPVVIADDAGRVLGVAHAGWRGLSGGVLERTLAAMRAKAPDAGGWRAWVGPGISPDAFEVGRDVLDVFMADDPATESISAPAGPARQMAGRPAWTGRVPPAARGRRGRDAEPPVHGCGRRALFVPARRDNRADGAAGLAVLGQV